MATRTKPRRLADLQARLRRAGAEIGFRGRFTAVFHQGDGSALSILHWVPVEGGREDCREVGHGSVEACLEALDRYVAERAAG